MVGAGSAGTRTTTAGLMGTLTGIRIGMAAGAGTTGAAGSVLSLNGGGGGEAPSAAKQRVKRQGGFARIVKIARGMQ